MYVLITKLIYNAFMYFVFVSFVLVLSFILSSCTGRSHLSLRWEVTEVTSIGPSLKHTLTLIYFQLCIYCILLYVSGINQLMLTLGPQCQARQPALSGSSPLPPIHYIHRS